jgi:hypothetical protein
VRDLVGEITEDYGLDRLEPFTAQHPAQHPAQAAVQPDPLLSSASGQ